MQKEKFMIYRRDAKKGEATYSPKLVRLSKEHTIAFKEEMQEAFQHGFEAYNKDAEETNLWQVLPDKDFRAKVLASPSGKPKRPCIQR